jgi:hypothetical protein
MISELAEQIPGRDLRSQCLPWKASLAGKKQTGNGKNH